MKPILTYRLRYYARLFTIGILIMVGFIAITGEPAGDSNFLLTIAIQLLTWGTTWSTAIYLYQRWEIDKYRNRTINK